MITVTPAILTDNKEIFAQKFEVYATMPVSQIDIDVAEDSFVGNTTLQVEDVLALLTHKVDQTIGFHLMLKYPKLAFNMIRDACQGVDQDYRVYIHQEADIDDLLQIQDSFHLGIAVMAESEMKDLPFYEQFPEVQFMTIKTGKQGNPFIPEVLEKVDKLRGLGYTGTITLDGGINMNTVVLIKSHQVDRLSVGSYLQNSDNPAATYQELLATLM